MLFRSKDKSEMQEKHFLIQENNMNYNLVITQPAKKDLADILQYISKDLSVPKAANDLLDDLLKCYDNISSNPLMYALCDNDRLKSKNTEKQL